MDSTQPLGYSSHLAQGRTPDGPWLIDPFKDCYDAMLALVLMAATAPLLAVAALLVKLTSRGPLLVSRLYVGQGGSIFQSYQLRTQRHEQDSSACQEDGRDVGGRLTFVGRFLRAAHVDELPVLWNVWLGEMSLVGPRPEGPEFVARLARILPFYEERLLVKPGFTGLAQVQAQMEKDLVGVRNMLALDLRYVEMKSLGLDIRILLATWLRMLGLGLTSCNGLCRLPTQASAVLNYVFRILKETRPVGRT
jgi:lipopolysaccharide/colanic/teichoic acid biosynthesis glycosyltransferase